MITPFYERKVNEIMQHGFTKEEIYKALTEPNSANKELVNFLWSNSQFNWLILNGNGMQGGTFKPTAEGIGVRNYLEEWVYP